ncbi:MAG: class I SAM-dependent methyltransferase [Chloroflexi bacterium]|nr:class I SAM-dependent methyltransferase [Chloroflexota bacterium]
MTTPDYSADFYRTNARQYAQVAQEWRQSVYIKSSHPGLQHDWDAWERLRQLTTGNRGLDAGCGAGARDVFHLWSQDYDVVGFDSVEENIQVARQLHPEIADRVFVASLGEALPFDDNSFDFVMCNAVIQHIEPEVVRTVVFSELARVLRPDGVLQLMFKNAKAS